MKIMSSFLTGVLISLPLLTHAATETRHYRGVMELVRLSGADCGNKIKQGDHIAINLAVRIAKGASGENYDGYFAGQKILTGHFAGNRADELALSYLGENPSGQQRNGISLHLFGDNPGGEIREKPLAASEPGCNFDLARLVLVPDATGDPAESAFATLAKRFKAEYENRQASVMFDEGKMPEAISHFEAEIKLLEDIEGGASEALIDPLLILSVAYCVSDRFDKGKELQDRVFSIPMDALKRKVWQVTVMQNLFAEQAKRLAQEGVAEKGIALLEKAVSGYPDLTGLYVQMAEMMIALDVPQEACIQIETAWSRQRNDSNLQNAQALCLIWKGRDVEDPDNPDLAITFFEQAWKLAPDNLDALAELEGAYIAKGAPDAALSLMKESAGKIIKEYGQKDYDTGLAAVYAAASNMAAKKQDYTMAESRLRTALELAPVSTPYTLKLANVVHKSGRFEEAMRLLDGWQKTCPDAVCREQTSKAIENERKIEIIVQKLYR